MLNFSMALYGPTARGALDPGEQLLAASSFAFFGGDTSGLDRERELAERGQPPKRSDRWLTGFSWFPFDFGPEVNQHRLDRMLAGRVGVGAVESAAGRLWSVGEKAGGSVHCAVTDRRFLLLQDNERKGPITETVPAQILVEVRRESIVSARWRPRFLIFGRIVIRFADGSSLAPVVSVFWPGGALRIVSALKKVTRRPEQEVR